MFHDTGGGVTRHQLGPAGTGHQSWAWPQLQLLAVDCQQHNHGHDGAGGDEGDLQDPGGGLQEGDGHPGPLQQHGHGAEDGDVRPRSCGLLSVHPVQDPECKQFSREEYVLLQ